MKKLITYYIFPVLLCICLTANGCLIAQSLKISGNISVNDDTTADNSIQFTSRKIQAILNLDIFPTHRVTTAGVSISPFSELKLYAGNIVPSGTVSRAKTPCFSIPSTLGSTPHSVPALKISLPTASTSDKTAVGFGAAWTLPFCTVSSYAAAADRQWDKAVWFAGIHCAPQYSPFSTALYAGSHVVESAPSKRWFRTAPWFPKQRLYFIIAEALYNGKYVAISTSNMVSTSPFGNVTASTRTTATFRKDIFTLEGGFFSCDADHFTFEGKAVRKTLSMFIHPFISVQFPTTISQSLSAGVTVSQEKSYTFHYNPVHSLLTDVSAAFCYTAGFFSVQESFKAEDIIHPANTVYEQALKLSFNPQHGSIRETYSAKAEYTMYPQASAKQNRLKCSMQAVVNFYSFVSTSIEQNITLDKAGNSLDFFIYEPYSFSTKIGIQLQFSGNHGRSSLYIKENISQTLKNSKKTTISFSLGYALYIKP